MPAADANSTTRPQDARGALESDNVSLVDPVALMRIKDLEMRAQVVVEGFCAGIHRSPVHGFSVEFSEYRQYTPGDDPRYLDWRLYARTDRYFVKRFEDETNLRCHFLVDLSRSMGYRSIEYTKAEYVRTLSATLAYFLSTQHDAVGLVTFDDQIREYVPARYRPGHLHRLMICLQRPTAGTATDLVAPIEQIASTVTKRGLIVLLSDFLTPIDVLQTNLGYLRLRGHEVVAIRVLDPAEEELQVDEPAMFHDLESGRDLYVDPEAARDEYRKRFAEHSAGIQRICGSLGIDVYTVKTDRPLELALYDFLNVRRQRGRQIARRGSTGTRGPG